MTQYSHETVIDLSKWFETYFATIPIDICKNYINPLINNNDMELASELPMLCKHNKVSTDICITSVLAYCDYVPIHMDCADCTELAKKHNNPQLPHYYLILLRDFVTGCGKQLPRFTIPTILHAQYIATDGCEFRAIPDTQRGAIFNNSTDIAIHNVLNGCQAIITVNRNVRIIQASMDYIIVQHEDKLYEIKRIYTRDLPSFASASYNLSGITRDPQISAKYDLEQDQSINLSSLPIIYDYNMYINPRPFPLRVGKHKIIVADKCTISIVDPNTDPEKMYTASAIQIRPGSRRDEPDSTKFISNWILPRPGSNVVYFVYNHHTISIRRWSLDFLFVD